jgi:hypothetical protein
MAAIWLIPVMLKASGQGIKEYKNEKVFNYYFNIFH